MLENSFGITFFLKSSTKSTKERYVYLRITVDGVPKEASTKRKWQVDRWSQRTERATGSREDAKVLNFFLETIEMKIQQFKSELMLTRHPITTERIMDFCIGQKRL